MLCFDSVSQTDDELRWMNAAGKLMENGIKHSTFDLALVLSQPPLSVLTPPFKPEVSFKLSLLYLYVCFWLFIWHLLEP